MKVKINSYIFDSERSPITLILNRSEVLEIVNIANVSDETTYISFIPKNMWGIGEEK